MNLDYLFLRTVRHFLPKSVTRFLLRRDIFIHPGAETSKPVQTVDRYESILTEHQVSLTGKRIMDFGYGGFFATGVELLRRGAGQVVLCDPYEPPDHRKNGTLLPEYQNWLALEKGKVLPKSGQLLVIAEDITRIPTLEPFDIILSSSVYEHLSDVPGVTRALHHFLKPGGVCLHFIDLRDHYFKLPFEMLCYTSQTWERWLNPTSNLNRLRMWNYRQIFSQSFSTVEIQILDTDSKGYQRAEHRIRPEFRSGDPIENAVTHLMVYGVY